MTYKIIYTPEGKRMEVVSEKANLLVLNSGWTQTKPIEEVKKPKVSRYKKSSDSST